MPLAVYLPRKTKPPKKCIINLNNYRNMHRMVENQVKRAYAAIAVPKLQEAGVKVPPGYRACLTYVMFTASARRIDRANVLTIHAKYAEDSMTEAGCFPDDNDEWIESQTFRTGGIDRDNPRVEIGIYLNNTNQPQLF